MEWSRVAIREEPPIRTAMRQGKHATAGLRAISREQRLLGVLDTPCSTRASGPAPWQAGAGCGTPKRDAWRRERHAHRARGDRRSRPLFERPCAPAVEHRRRGRSWSATRWACTVSETTQAHEGVRCSKVAGNVVALLRAAVQARKRLCRDGSGLRGYRSRAGGAAVCSDEERGVR